MRKNTDKEFVKRLAVVKKKLPKTYLPILNYEFPEKYKDTYIYSVVHRHHEDWHVLTDLEIIARKFEENKKKILKNVS